MFGGESETAIWDNLAINLDRSDHIGQSVDLKEVLRGHFYLLIVWIVTLLFLSLFEIIFYY